MATKYVPTSSSVDCDDEKFGTKPYSCDRKGLGPSLRVEVLYPRLEQTSYSNLEALETHSIRSAKYMRSEKMRLERIIKT